MAANHEFDKDSVVTGGLIFFHKSIKNKLAWRSEIGGNRLFFIIT